MSSGELRLKVGAYTLASLAIRYASPEYSVECGEIPALPRTNAAVFLAFKRNVRAAEGLLIF